MNIDFSDEEAQIIGAFLRRYILASQEAGKVLDKLYEGGSREAIAINIPYASKFLESHTQEELNTKLMILAIAFSVASAIVEGIHLQDK